MSSPRSPSAFGVLFCMRLAAALSHRNVPIRLMCTTLAKRSPAIGPFLPSTRPAPTTPAQFTSRFIPPMRDAAVSIVELTSASEVTSQRRKLALAPNFAAVAWPGPSCTSRMTTLPPLETTWLATAAPRPDAPPVTTARASSIFIQRSPNRASSAKYFGPQVDHTRRGIWNGVRGRHTLDPARQGQGHVRTSFVRRFERRGWAALRRRLQRPAPPPHHHRCTARRYRAYHRGGV